jgi:hypothetical protein
MQALDDTHARTHAHTRHQTKESELCIFKKFVLKFSLQSLLTKPYRSGIHKVKALLNPEGNSLPHFSKATGKIRFSNSVSFLEY